MLKFPGYNLAEGETFSVKVFRNHPDWDKYEKWWMMPSHLIRELFVDQWDCDCQEHLDWLEKQYPDHVFVY